MKTSDKAGPAFMNNPSTACKKPDWERNGQVLAAENSVAVGKLENRSGGLKENGKIALVCLFIMAITWFVFGQTLRHEFVNFDDNEYVTENPVVQEGITLNGLRWALTSRSIGHWHPLTWISHMVDCQFYGPNAGGHHLTNVVLHGAAAIVLFLMLRQMTGSLWRSAFVATVFAIHPLRVESVAWISERKDVLSGFFFMLTLWAYFHYARQPFSAFRYGIVVALFALGLLSKNMLVTLPFVLLLMDYWPLGRLSNHRILFRRVLEKIPLMILSIGSCVATFLSPEKMFAEDKLPFLLRMENAAVSQVIYIWQMICPVGLICFYPNPTESLPPGEVAGAIVALLAMTSAAVLLRKTYPYLFVGWFWYVGMLIPVIGILQISLYAHADRYTYLPQIGLYLLLTWTAADIGSRWGGHRIFLGAVSACVLAALALCAHTQVSYWRNSESLWVHTAACAPDNVVVHANLGNVLLEKHDVDGAIAHYRKALTLKPRNAGVHYNLGVALLENGSLDDAITEFQTSFQLEPDSALTCKNLGYSFAQQGNREQAIVYLDRTLRITPDDPEVQNNLAWLLATAPQASLRNGARAVVLAERASQSDGGNNPNVLHTLAAAYAESGRFDDAVSCARKAIEMPRAIEQSELAQQLTDNLKLYEAGRPFHEESR
jgi:Flp pilus assembly protein TadD